MREIKFRAKNRETGEWEYSTKNDLADFFYGIEDGQMDGEMLGQYTGLKDKNGKEIYEGDILKEPLGKGNPMWEVLWYQNAWQQKLMGNDPPYYVRLSSQRVVEFDEVIGNIYENPELLSRKVE